MSKKMKLGEICNFINGRAFKPSEWEKEGLPIVRIQNLNDENAEFNFCSKAIEDKYIIEDNQLLFSWSGTPGTSFGAFFWNRGKAILNQHIFKVIPKININIEFLKYLLNGKLDIIISKSHGGVGLQHITKRELEKIIVYIPDDKRQEYVVKTLNEITKIINNRKEQLKQFDEIIKSQFVGMFGNVNDNKNSYEIKTLNEVFEFIKDGTHSTPTYTNDKINGIKFLSAKDVTKGIINWENIKYIPLELHEQLVKRVKPQKGDILLAKNGTTGVCAKVDRDEIFDIYVSLALLRPKEGYVVDYLVQAINNDMTKEQFDRSLKGVGVPNLHLGEIQKVKIIVPPIELQNQFAEIVKQIDKQKFEIENSLKEMQGLYESLMEKYFG